MNVKSASKLLANVEGNFFLSKFEFNKVLEEIKVAYALVAKEATEEIPKVLELLVLLLDEFGGITPN